MAELQPFQDSRQTPVNAPTNRLTASLLVCLFVSSPFRVFSFSRLLHSGLYSNMCLCLCGWILYPDTSASDTFSWDEDLGRLLLAYLGSLRNPNVVSGLRCARSTTRVFQLNRYDRDHGDKPLM